MAVMLPSPSVSNNWKASLYSAISSAVSWSAYMVVSLPCPSYPSSRHVPFSVECVWWKQRRRTKKKFAVHYKRFIFGFQLPDFWNSQTWRRFSFLNLRVQRSFKWCASERERGKTGDDWIKIKNNLNMAIFCTDLAQNDCICEALGGSSGRFSLCGCGHHPPSAGDCKCNAWLIPTHY